MEKFMTTVHTPVDNGVNVDALLGVREALADTPEIAQFQWRTRVSWVAGTHSRSSVDTFYGFGEEQRHKTTFTYDADHPLAFAAQDNGVTPVDYMLVALGSCLTAGIASIAQQRQIQLRSVQGDHRCRRGPARNPGCRSRNPQRLLWRQGELQDRRGRERRPDQSPCRAVAEALSGL
jgi:hypothetical protein